ERPRSARSAEPPDRFHTHVACADEEPQRPLAPRRASYVLVTSGGGATGGEGSRRLRPLAPADGTISGPRRTAPTPPSGCRSTSDATSAHRVRGRRRPTGPARSSRRPGPPPSLRRATRRGATKSRASL